ncbi:hypothetical protein HPP92_022142 [Vanilla planifolia]|uniref:Protein TRIGALACTOSYLDIACYLGLYCEROL 4, chloroplastic n=1 Tax=Vanilla planifolia TaxID=51239 RepID=A0A835PWS4_VANPL|nr:hypothetical protein HPP92_022142 [Vanilla planifolia]
MSLWLSNGVFTEISPKPQFRLRYDHDKIKDCSRSRSEVGRGGVRTMANLRLAMDAAFWDLNVASPRTLDGVVRLVAGDPAPSCTARASRTSRPQQLALLRHFLPFKIIPSFSPTLFKELGSFCLQSLLLAPAFNNVWALRYCLAAVATNDTSLVFNVERHGERKGHQAKAMIFHKLPNHDVTLEAAWPELYIGGNGAYWEVPSSASLDVLSLVSNSGFRYRFGLHKNDGEPRTTSSGNEIPLSLLPGICAKAAFSIEKSRDLWQKGESKSIVEKQLKKESARLIPYDKQLKDPHAAISVIFGGICEAWFGRKINKDASSETQVADEVYQALSSFSRRKRLNADLFGSLAFTFQQGQFANYFNDLTRLDARLDVSSASVVLKDFSRFMSTFFKGQFPEVNPLASTRLNVLVQQQIAGPIVFRVDSRFAFKSLPASHLPCVEDVVFGLSYSLRRLESGKLLAWYSAKRKEGMIELRFFEF